MVQKALALNPHPPPWLRMSISLDHYRNGRYEAALAEAINTETGDYRTPLFRAAAYGQLGRLEEAQRALSEMRVLRPEVEDIRQDLIERHAFAPALVDQLLEGLAKAGFESGL